MKKNWYTIAARAGEQPPEISIHDEIGWHGVTARQFIDDLRAIDAKRINLSINSIGGQVFDALAIYNALLQHPAAIHVNIIGIAASSASLIAMAGDHVTISENAFVMVHNPLNGIHGNAEDLRNMADVLDKVGASLVSTYVARTGQTEEKIREMLAAETWLTGAEAVAMGFADELAPALRIAASCDRDRLPESIRAMFPEAPQPTAGTINPAPSPAIAQLAPAIVARSAAAGLGQYVDAFLLDDSLDSDERIDAAIRDAGEIAILCKACHVPEHAGALIRARVPVASVHARLQAMRDALDDIPTAARAGRPGDPQAQQKCGLEIWDRTVFNRP